VIDDGKPRLSICIPTYNFGEFIGATLASIVSQMPPQVEIVVLDSGSTDDTAKVVRAFQAGRHAIRYEYAPERCGIDRDLATVVGLARGEYCWLFSADDVMREGAISRVLEETSHGVDVLLSMHSNNTLAMEQIEASHPVLALTEATTFQLADRSEQLRYFALASTTEAFFSFMTGIVVKTATWRSVPLDERFVGTCWAHVARMFQAMRSSLAVRFLPQVLVDRRGDNDSFSTSGVVRRYRLAIAGYLDLACHFWGEESPQTFHIRRVLRREFPIRLLLRAKTTCAQNPATEDRALLDDLTRRLYADVSLACTTKLWIYRCFPTGLITPARALYRLLRGRSPLPG
jgi:abequosyltransferase